MFAAIARREIALKLSSVAAASSIHEKAKDANISDALSIGVTVILSHSARGPLRYRPIKPWAETKGEGGLDSNSGLPATASALLQSLNLTALSREVVRILYSLAVSSIRINCKIE